jgi:hypothetical protein
MERKRRGGDGGGGGLNSDWRWGEEGRREGERGKREGGTGVLADELRYHSGLQYVIVKPSSGFQV